MESMDHKSYNEDSDNDNEPKDLSPKRSREFSPLQSHSPRGGQRSDISPGLRENEPGNALVQSPGSRPGSAASHGKISSLNLLNTNMGTLLLIESFIV